MHSASCRNSNAPNARRMAHHFRPSHDRVLLKQVEVEKKTPAGVIIPDTAKEKPVEGQLLAVGP